MALDPQRKQLLAKYTKAAKAIIYNADRMKQIAPMLDTRDGAVKAVSTVISTIEQKKPVPQEIKIYLGINIYIMIVDLIQDAYGKKPDKKAVMLTGLEIVKSLAAPKQATPQTQQTSMPQAGLIGGV